MTENMAQGHLKVRAGLWARDESGDDGALWICQRERFGEMIAKSEAEILANCYAD